MCFVSTFLVSVALASVPAVRPVRAVSLSGGGWQFQKDGVPGWENVEVPHDWAAAGPFDAEARTEAARPGLYLGFAFTGKLPWIGKGRYRRTFTLDEEDLAGAVRLEFDGVMARPEVFLNGQKAGGWDYGYMSFTVDATPFVRCGANTLEVTADTTGIDARWHPGGGLYRDVRLVRTGRDHVVPGSLFVTTPEVSRERALVHVSYEAACSGRTNFSFTVESPRLWDVDDPYLYTLTILGETFRYGIRTMEFTADDGFHLNGRRLPLKGANLHHDLGILGAAMDPDARRRQLLILKDMGVNAIRTSHNALDPFTLDLCDEMGFVVWNEGFDKWTALCHRREVEPLESYVVRNLKAFVRRDRNHPCVAVWSIGNEIRPASKTYPDGMTRARCRLFRGAIRALDPTRPVGVGCCHTGLLKGGTLTDLDVLGWNYQRRYVQSQKRFSHKPVVYTESASTLSSFGHYCLPPAGGRLVYDVEAREIDSYDHCAASWSDIPDWEFERMEQDRQCAGEFVWTALDYIGEPTPFVKRLSCGMPGVSKIPEKEFARSSYFGAVDLTGFPKDRFFLYRSHWNRGKETVHLLPHWNWAGREGTNIPVYVYTNGDEAELFLNGRSLGRRKKLVRSFPAAYQKPRGYAEDAAMDFRTNAYYSVCDKYRLRWLDVPYEPGTLRAVAYRDGRRIGEASVTTAGTPVRLRLERDPYSPADARTVFVRVSAEDAAGRPHPLAAHRVRFRVTGEARLVAVGNGNARAYEPFGGDVYPLYHGRAMAAVRLNPGGASATLSVSADGLEPFELKLERKQR